MPATTSASHPRQWRPLLRGAVATLLASAVGGLLGVVAQGGQPLVAAGVAGACCAALSAGTAFGRRRLEAQLAQARRQLDQRTTLDPLTGAQTRVHFMVLAERELARCRRYHTGGAFLLIDADHFRRVNDAHGHLCGDALLREIALVAAGSLRQPDLIARFGGEAFAVLLPHTDPLGALDVADRIRERVAQLAVRWQGVEVGTTVSIGVATMHPDHASLDALVRDADAALAAAKAAGRNCVRAAPVPPPQRKNTTASAE